DVVEPARRRLGREKRRDRRRVLDVQEVARLLAVPDALAVAPEELDRAALADLLVRLRHDAAHRALVVLVRAVDVEVLDAHRALEQPFAPHPQIEEVLRVPVHVQRAQRVRIEILAHVGLARAVRRGGGRVDQARVARERPARDLLGAPHVVRDQVRRVALRRRGAGAEMEDRRDGAEGVRRGLDAGEELFRVEIVGEAQRDEMLPLLARPEPVDRDHVVGPGEVQRAEERAADETGRARDHHAPRGANAAVHATSSRSERASSRTIVSTIARFAGAMSPMRNARATRSASADAPAHSARTSSWRTCVPTRATTRIPAHGPSASTSSRASSPSATVSTATTIPSPAASARLRAGSTASASSAAPLPPCASIICTNRSYAAPPSSAACARTAISSSTTPPTRSISCVTASTASASRSSRTTPRRKSRASMASMPVPTAGPSGSSMSETSALARRSKRPASVTSARASSVASSSVRMNAPRPAFTSNTIASAPPAIFFETIDAAMSPTDGTLPVRSRSA